MKKIEIIQWGDSVEIKVYNGSKVTRVSIDQEDTHERLINIFKTIDPTFDIKYTDAY